MQNTSAVVRSFGVLCNSSLKQTFLGATVIYGYGSLRNIATTKIAVKYYGQVRKELFKNTFSCRFVKVKTDNE